MANYGLVIGIEEYPEHRSLRGAVRDARDVHQWLTSPEGGNVPAANCRLVKSRQVRPETTGPTHRPAPLKPTIDSSLREVLTQAFQANDGDRFYFYFSGHGLGMTPMNNALCLADWSQIAHNSSLSSESYLNMVINSRLFEEIVFIFDCCRDAVQFKYTGDGPNFEMPPRNKVLKARLIAYATQFGNPSFEAEMGTSTTEAPLVSGLFTKALIEALKERKALDPLTGRITTQSLSSFLKKRTPELAEASDRKQEAEILGDLTTPLFFGPAGPGPTEAGPPLTPCQIDFSAGRQAPVLVQNGNLKVIATCDRVDVPFQLDLPPGLYRLSEANAPQVESLFTAQPQTTPQHVIF